MRLGLATIVMMAILCFHLPSWSGQQPTTSTLPDGTKVTTHPDGSQTSDYPDGSRFTRNADGSRTTEQTTKGPDGQSTTTRTTYRPDGTRVTEPPTPPVEDKPVATRQRRDGGTEYRYADGTRVKFKGNGDVEIEQPGPTGTTETIYKPDGRRLVSGPPGTLQSAAPAGTTNMFAIMDTRPKQNFCFDAEPSEVMDKFKLSLGLSPTWLGKIDGYGSMFNSPASPQQIQEAAKKSGLNFCMSFKSPEPDYCSIFTPLTAFRGHDEKPHQGGPHDHDAPDPPLTWGVTPPETVIRWEAER
ncbi:MAG: hypothetical protein HYV04_14765 [Deltaproteobacteria bacterium]|nr:hypothetical protein [Deltaproteobacteria bacterium]